MFKKLNRAQTMQSITPYSHCFMSVKEVEELKAQGEARLAEITAKENEERYGKRLRVICEEPPQEEVRLDVQQEAYEEKRDESLDDMYSLTPPKLVRQIGEYNLTQ